MNTLVRNACLLGALAVLTAGTGAHAADPEREARLVRDLRAVVRTGEPLLLDLPQPAATGAPGQGAAPEPAAEDPAEADAGEAAQEPAADPPIPVPEGLAVEPTAEETPGPPDEPPEPETAANAPAPETAAPPAGPRVFALYLPPDNAPPRGGVVLLHDLGGHPDWPEVVAPLRRQLPKDGWATLAVQMPLPAPNETADGRLLEEAVPRIEAAVAELSGRGHEPVVLAGHGAGAAMAAAYLRNGERQEVAGAVVINPGLPGAAPGDLDLAAAFSGAGIPVLNIHGSDAPHYVLDTASALAGDGITRIRILGAGYAFEDLQASLVPRIRGWLRRALEKKGGSRMEGGA